MSLHPKPISPVPKATEQVAKAAFPKGNLYLTMRDELGTIYTDGDFEALFSLEGHPAIAPWQLALISVMQYMEGLTDRQAAEAVRSRIDWKYALGLELTDSGFDFSVLSEFRSRLIEGKSVHTILDKFLEQCQSKGWLKARGSQRTDSTHILGAIRLLNRLECLGETLRAALNALAIVAPSWLLTQAEQDWFDRYSRPVCEERLPKGIEARTTYAEKVGVDGMRLLDAIYDDLTTPEWLRQLESIEILRQTWIHQYFVENGQLRLRQAKDLAPSGQRFDSPYDTDARYGNKRTTTWTGYKVHLTETCAQDEVHLITNVETTQANRADVDQTELIHQSLKAKALLPDEHLVDAGYVDATLLLLSQKHYGVTIIGPMRPNASWQSKTSDAYDISQFKINWNTKRVTCPMGKKSLKKWIPYQDQWGNSVIRVSFPRKTCLVCPSRSLCTHAKTEARRLTLRQKNEHELIQSQRLHQETPEWKKIYQMRAGIEGTISQGVRAFGLRKARYRGLAKVQLQHILTATAINFVRMVAWLDGIPLARTRISRFALLRPNDGLLS
jgi:transposase